jgi:hypothetical protein
MPVYMIEAQMNQPSPSYWAKRYGTRHKRKRCRIKIGAKLLYVAKPEIDRGPDAKNGETFGGYLARDGTTCTVVLAHRHDLIVEFSDGFRGIVFGEELMEPAP